MADLLVWIASIVSALVWMRVVVGVVSAGVQAFREASPTATRLDHHAMVDAACAAVEAADPFLEWDDAARAAGLSAPWLRPSRETRERIRDETLRIEAITNRITREHRIVIGHRETLHGTDHEQPVGRGARRRYPHRAHRDRHGRDQGA